MQRGVYLRIMTLEEFICCVQSPAHFLYTGNPLVEHQRLAIVGQGEQEVKNRMEICIVGGKQSGRQMPASHPQKEQH